MKHIRILSLTLCLPLLFVFAAYAASGGSITFDGTGDATPGDCNDVDLDYHYSFTATTDDGSGTDYIAIVMVDANGTPLDVDFFDYALGSVSDTDFTDLGLISSIAARPVTIALFDIGDPGSLDENTVAGFNFAISGKLLAQDAIDPATVATDGSCAGLPLQATYWFGAQDNCLVLPAGSVVGDAPFETQAYYAPGEVSPGVILNPGTYWVIGEDESGAYYKIMLSCQYLWVPVESMQPSFQSPWNGQPLPTRVVE